jgi:hypothetical protein
MSDTKAGIHDRSISMEGQEERLFRAVLEINNRVLAVTFALFFGTAIGVATLWLVVKGGANVGTHLSLLAQFFPGYTVSYMGSIVGFAYGFVCGYVAGWAVGWLYNRVVYLQHGSGRAAR